MTTDEYEIIKPENGSLFDRVVTILEQARTNVVRTINNNMVLAYWLIGREIVQEIQGGEERAEYGKQLIEQLSEQLSEKYGRGFSTTNLRYFRTFFTVYSNRKPIISHIQCGESDSSKNRHTQGGVLDDLSMAVEKSNRELGFSPNLGWSHYRLLMGVDARASKKTFEFLAFKAMDSCL